MEKKERIGLFFIFVIILIAGIAVGVGLTASFNKVIPVQGADSSVTSKITAGQQGNEFLRQSQETFRGIVQAVSPAVVTIKVVTKIPGVQMDPFHNFDQDPFFKFFFGPGGPQSPQQQAPKEQEVPASGSGFIVDPKGYILTNNHVVANADQIKVVLSGNDEHDAKVIGLDPDSDVAVLKLDGDGPYPYIELGDSDSVYPGDWVIAMGNPFGYLDKTVTVGVISAKNREHITGTQYENFLQTDAAINFGNSGGPLVDINGRAIGINTAITAQGSGIGFAVPINMAKQVYNDFLNYGEVRRAWVGISIRPPTEDEIKSLGLKDDKGALVIDVSKGDPADKAGVKLNDFIVKVNGTATTTPSQVSRIIAEQEIGKPFNLTVLRDGKEVTLSVTPSKRAGTPIIQGGKNTVDIKELGLTVRDIDSDVRKQANIPDNLEGIVITNVSPGSNAYNKGLRPGVVITQIEGVPVTTVEQFVTEFNKVKTKSAVVLDVTYINSDGSTESDVVALKLK